MKKILLACGLGLCSTLAQTQSVDFSSFPQFSVPEIGSGVGLLDQQKERAIGEKVYREVHRQLPVTENPWMEDRLLSVFTHILSQTQLNQPVGLLLINDPQINAFAVPGGLFALNAGLINSARNMDEVAGVMAHEIAHVSQRHYSRSQEAFKGQGLLSLAGILVGALVASQADGDVGAAVMMGSQAALMDKQLTYSRNQEREADRIGMQYMYRAGYNPQSMADFFEVMHRSTSRVSFLPDFWLTHPLTTERMSEARLRANQLPQVKTSLVDQDFEILRWYSRVLSGQATELQLNAMVAQKNYAAELALVSLHIKQGDFSAAQKLLNEAAKQNASHALFIILQTDVLLGQNKTADAVNAVKSSAIIMPENRALNYKYAEALIRNKEYAQAQLILQRFLQANPLDLTGWRLMLQMADADKDASFRSVNVLRYRAEVEYWGGDEERAIKSLLQAQRIAKDSKSLSAKIKQRVDEMQNERKLKI
ncbi:MULTISPECIES: M48 family metalloprotease [unclassified Acinetobacter]|uniref:M48 family metalloprotease n=1 Tax=unclassified Acinetobacter TaxID=196816 RepID=UPI0015D16EE5|nr:MULTISPECIES: M48 family metalloprotease [unclassified Acinetobacter]